MAATTHKHAGSIVKAVSAFDTNHARHGVQYAVDAPWRTTLAAPSDAPTAGATPTATKKKIESPCRLSRLGLLDDRRCNRTAATSARAMFATSASTTQD